MGAGRPTKYDDTMVSRVEEYLKLCVDEEVEFHATRGEKSDSFQRHLRVKIPNIEGLAVYLHVNKTTLYEWEKDHEEFSNVMDELRATQAQRLIDGGMSGDYNPTIAKVLLTKHGYREGTDMTTDGQKLEGVVVLPAKNESTLGTTTEASQSA